MPRRKIGADLKEALCKLYEAGDLSADTIEKHGIMSRATFFRNLKMWKAGDSLEQRHSTGRKTNADKRKEQEQLEVDQLQPPSLLQLKLSLLEDSGASSSRLPPSEKSLGKKRDHSEVAGAVAAAVEQPEDASGRDRERSLSADADDEDGDEEENADAEAEAAAEHDAEGLNAEQRRRKSEEAREFCLRMIKQTYGFDYAPTWHDDLDSLLDPDGNQYSARHRGAFWVVRQSSDDMGPIVATAGLRSFIWKPQLYQSLGARYASKSIDRVGYLGRLYIDPIWRRRGIGRWLTNVAELKASKYGFTTMYLHATASADTTISFWKAMEYADFGDIDGNTHFDKPIIPNVPPPLKERRKRPNNVAASGSSSSAAGTGAGKSKRVRIGPSTSRPRSQNHSSPSSKAASTARQEANYAADRQSPLLAIASNAATSTKALAIGGGSSPEHPAVTPEGSRLDDGDAKTQQSATPPLVAFSAAVAPSLEQAIPASIAATASFTATTTTPSAAAAAPPSQPSALPCVSSRAAVSLPPPPRKITFHEAIPLIRPPAVSQTSKPAGPSSPDKQQQQRNR